MPVVQQLFLLVVGGIVSGVCVFAWMRQSHMKTLEKANEMMRDYLDLLNQVRKMEEWKDRVVRNLPARDIPTGEFPVIKIRQEG
jgi:F420-dependent methylenetetrahydromethanopterin dehydrogenase